VRIKADLHIKPWPVAALPPAQASTVFPDLVGPAHEVRFPADTQSGVYRVTPKMPRSPYRMGGQRGADSPPHPQPVAKTCRHHVRPGEI
jgi:hypothetical protein